MPLYSHSPSDRVPLGTQSERWQAHQHGKLEIAININGLTQGPIDARYAALRHYAARYAALLHTGALPWAGVGARSKDQVRPEAPPRPLRQREVSRPLLFKCRWPSLLRKAALAWVLAAPSLSSTETVLPIVCGPWPAYCIDARATTAQKSAAAPSNASSGAATGGGSCARANPPVEQETRATEPVRRHGGGKVADRPKEALANDNWHD
jgi:hypothetical protein